MSPRRLRIAAQISGNAAIAGGVFAFVLEVTANQLSSLGYWVPWTVMIAGLVVYLILWAMNPRRPPPPDLASDDTMLPIPHPLVGQEATIAAVRAKARENGVVVVHGPDGIGVSSVAITAAWDLVPDEARHRYVDLRSVRPDDQDAVRVQVLRTLGMPTRYATGPARRLISTALRNARLVLLLDNVTDARQVSWIAHPVPGSYVIVAGELKADAVPPEVAEVPVLGLSQEDALTLLRRQDVTPELRPRRFPWWPPRAATPRDSIAARIERERRAAAELADHYLKHPRVVIELGRWLAVNPQVTISQLLADLEQGGEAFELAVILRRQLSGASAGARRLLALLATVPAGTYTDEAIARLLRAPMDRTSEHLGELTKRFLVRRTSSRYSLARQAVALADPVRRRARDAAFVRLVAHYAELAAEQADRLGGGEYARAGAWFAGEDVTLRRLLAVPHPPRKAGAQLWRIADALEAWFARDQRLTDRKDVAEAMVARATELEDTSAQAVAHLRLAAIARSERRLWEARDRLNRAEELGRGKVPWRPQLHTEWALLYLASGDPHAAREQVRRAREVRPPRDIRGRVTDLINAAAVDVHDRAYGAALERLVACCDLAEHVGDLRGQAQAHELLGVVAGEQDDKASAGDRWRTAAEIYRKVGDEGGLARCGRHRAVAGLAPDDTD